MDTNFFLALNTCTICRYLQVICFIIMSVEVLKVIYKLIKYLTI